MNEILQSLMDPLTKIFLAGAGLLCVGHDYYPNLHLFCV